MIILLYVYLTGFLACETRAVLTYADKEHTPRVITRGEDLAITTVACTLWPIWGVPMAVNEIKDAIEGDE